MYFGKRSMFPVSGIFDQHPNFIEGPGYLISNFQPPVSSSRFQTKYEQLFS